MKSIIIVEGYLASGKSTFALKLSRELRIPYLMKDTFKTALCENMGPMTRAESSRFSSVTFNAILYAAERIMEAGLPLILEGNFAPAGVKKTDEAGAVKHLIDKYGYTSLTFKFMGDTHVLHDRFSEREKSPERGQANTLGIAFTYEDFNKWCHSLDAFHVGGEIVNVDTTDFDAVDFERYIEMAKRFVEEV